ncbi:hypothetical protein FLP10_15575 [Agromyces intestinalis]|uniref:Uncharacterized protein n=1 Tax=Agromyces intestinalis TaxID=2592652 RepID=A0A5C1YJC1_9MICO|nr:hypothetical protein [Agromyces intestinalis]QEO15688.1 hypothetical protein FLP10_15575 [Agromyces intestinalis]
MGDAHDARAAEPAAEHAADPTTKADRASAARLVADYARTEHGVHGVVLVSALTAVGWHFDTDLEVLWFIVGSVVVLWLTHVYAAVVAGRRTPEGRGIALWRAILTAAGHTSGLLVAMLLPVFFLLLAVIGLIDEYLAYYLALWVGVVELAVMGWLNSARNESPWWLRALSALITAGFGLAVIWLGTLVH